ncbi:MAG: alpha/beta hydrolase family protein [Isosphaeraceae bacterium]
MRTANQGSPSADYETFIRLQARGGSGRPETAPATLDGWDRRLASVRDRLGRSFGRMPGTPCPLAPEVLGVLNRDGYAIERLTFQSRPGVRVTANLYRPDPVRGPYPGVVSVHGHWAWARIDPHVQPRCIGLAKLGYVVLCVDAFGAGERAIELGPGTYHGALTGASLWAVGTPLIGLQVYDNRRAVDFLVSRPEVDATKLAITGASGGGNQSFYAGATDERLSAVIPVCGIGTYDAYLTTACCVCEVNPGGASYATTADLLAMIAPRALMVISATRDALQFSVGEAAKSLAIARERFRLLGVEDRIRHVPIESGHDYNKPMREAMYGWVEKWLRGRADGRPIPEPLLVVEDVESLRCYPKGTARPKTVVTIPEFARSEGLERLAALPQAPDHRERWAADSGRMKDQLRDQILGGFPRRTPLDFQAQIGPNGVEITIATESGIRSRALANFGEANRGIALVVSPGPRREGDRDEPGRAALEAVRMSWSQAGYGTLELNDFRGTGRWLAGNGPVVGVADHTVAEWGLWVGRPLLGQWVWDIIRWIDLLEDLRRNQVKAPKELTSPNHPFVLIGIGAMSLPAIIAAALDDRVAGVACSDCLVSFVARGVKPWSGVPMGLIAPNILEVGDVGHLAALVAPRPLVVESGIEPEGGPAEPDRLLDAFRFTRAVYSLLQAPSNVTLGRVVDVTTFVPRP